MPIFFKYRNVKKIVKRHYISKGLCKHGIYKKYFISDCKRVCGGCLVDALVTFVLTSLPCRNQKIVETFHQAGWPLTLSRIPPNDSRLRMFLILLSFSFSVSTELRRWSITGHPRRVSSKDQTGCFTTLKVLNYFIAKLIEISQLSFSPPHCTVRGGEAAN